MRCCKPGAGTHLLPHSLAHGCLRGWHPMLPSSTPVTWRVPCYALGLHLLAALHYHQLLRNKSPRV